MDAKYVFHLVWGGGKVFLYNGRRRYILLRQGEEYDVSEMDGKESGRTLGTDEMKTFIGRMLAKEPWGLTACSVGSKIPPYVPACSSG
jgi:hypothetical protein